MTLESAPESPDPDAAGVSLRKIIHVDMDAFFASVEQRDDPSLRGRPVAVGGSSGRGLVAAASYEARRFGVRSAMPSVTAKRKCPELIFCKSRFEVYREVSDQVRAIFHRFTPLVEPLSLDEAYLDVTEDLPGIGSATRIAQAIRAAILAETQLTASAGVSYNKFLAKLASDHNKPDGLCVILPGQGAAFVQALPIRRFRGIGPRGEQKMARLGIATGADLAARDLAWLTAHFGSFGDYLWRAARAIDERPVKTSRARKSIGGERTLGEDIAAPGELAETLERIVGIVWERIADKNVRGRTVTLKLKFADFRLVTRARSLPGAVAGRAQLQSVARELLEAELPLPKPIRLMGLALSNLEPEPGEDGEAPGPAQLSLL